VSTGVGVGVGIAFIQAPAAASFDPSFEYSPDPGFDNPAAGTLAGTGSSITGSQLVLSNVSGFSLTYAPTATLVPGTYRATIDTATVVNQSSMNAFVGGTSHSVSTNPTGSHFFDIVVSSVTVQEIKITTTNGKSGAYNSYSVKRIA
jgi:hypothetical protein